MDDIGLDERLKNIESTLETLGAPQSPRRVIQKPGSQTVSFVPPEQLSVVYETLKRNHERVYSDVFLIGVNTGLRIGDILNINHMQHIRLGVKPHLKIRIAKTGVKQRIPLNKACLTMIAERIEEKPSREGSGPFFDFLEPYLGAKRAVSRKSVHRKFRAAGLRYQLHIGCHSMRKTFGLLRYAGGEPLECIANDLGHTSSQWTKTYIGAEYWDAIKRAETYSSDAFF